MNLKIYGGRNNFYQWDTGQQLIVEDDGVCSEVHFCCAALESALICEIKEECGKRIVDVPNILLQFSGSIIAYLFARNNNGSETYYSNSFLVLRRAKPQSYVYTETELLTYNMLDERVKVLENAEPFHTDMITESIEMYMSENPVTPENIGALPADALETIINEALAQAMVSGEFKGEPGPQGPSGATGERGADGYTPIKGIDYFDGKDGADGIQGPQGEIGPTGPQGAEGVAGVGITSIDIEEV